MDEKIFRDTRTHIGILKSRGLVIKNKKSAIRILRNCNYYNLINGYKEPFLQTGTVYEKYLPGTRFEEVYALYEFDRKLRAVTLEFILEVEKQIKSLTAYWFSNEYGHKDYLKPENFDIHGTKKYEQVCNLLSSIYKKIALNIDKDPSISHYVNGMNYIPLWVLVNSISMGDISKFYSSMQQHDRDEVARRMKWGLRENQLANSLFFLATIRNRCAHDERLYSYLSHTYLCQNQYFKYFHIKTGTNNYFATMVALKMVLSSQHYIDYYEKIENLLNELSSKLVTIPTKKIRNSMGFPNNWQRLKKL